MSLTLQIAVAAVVGYLGLVRALRWRKYDAVHNKYAHKLVERDLSPAEAQEIVQLALGYDMHYVMILALGFALYKTYGIPSISKLLVATKELSTEANVSRRVADTELLIATWTSCPINGHYPGAAQDGTQSDHRAMLSMARVNWIHSKYHISNADFLYTLSLFLLEPLDWAERYGWRQCSELEKYAWFVYWVEIGKRMNIQDIPSTFDELKAWSSAYEEQHMVPAESNAEVAKRTTDENLYRVPAALGLKAFARRLTVCLVGERVRVAMLLEAQPWYMHAIVRLTMGLVALVQKHLMLPRRKMASLVMTEMPSVDPATGKVKRMHPHKFQPRPWYMPEPSNALAALVMRLSVWAGIYECPPGPQLKCEGYYLHEMGPVKFEDDGQKETFSAAEELLGCPIASHWTTLGMHDLQKQA
ncbi:hypothetical protein BD626DRAFT_163255 [Schizophyllum amplum]|uniref:ER-bound oxygenase mpaB/mpaB'/Rubber oxygenase catalytic domain-containing protein n=1 Tax=Schizophyllum amplum TaxID=97359 RepID=A0A550CPL2_9AGAR|nr:hypothetical protein BD626DRAFT_163255 [Auriculariopsis ampla]